MGKQRKPSVITKCVANRYARNGARIIEFSHLFEGNHDGGLISFRRNKDGYLVVDVYRCTEGVLVQCDRADLAEKDSAYWKDAFDRLQRKVAHGCTDANCSICDKDAPS